MPSMCPGSLGLNKEVLIKIEILEVQDLCLATLEGHDRLDYAKGLVPLNRGASSCDLNFHVFISCCSQSLSDYKVHKALNNGLV